MNRFKSNTDTRDKKIAIYSRKSRFTGKGESVENQIEMCRSYISTRLPELADREITVYEDEGFSGSNLNRPQFQQMMADASAGKISTILVYRLDRISRNTADFTSLIRDLEDKGIDFVSIREQFDTTTPAGRAMMYMSSVFSQLERETIAERIRDNMHQLARTGRWLGGVPPTGYASQPAHTVDAFRRKHRISHLIVIPQEADDVYTIYSAFLATGSLTGTAALLHQQRLLTKNGRPYSRYTIKAILKNPVYASADQDTLAYFQSRGALVASPPECFDGIGSIMAYNKTLQRAGRAHKQNPVSQWIIAVGNHQSLISGRDWVTVQNIFERNKRRTPEDSPVSFTL